MGSEFFGGAQNAEMRNTVREFCDVAKQVHPYSGSGVPNST